jgi:hypothetical protein
MRLRPFLPIVPALVGLLLLCATTGCAAPGGTSATAATAPAIAASAPAQAAPVSTSDVAAVRDTVYYLASDDLAGRGIGSPGLDMAADFIAQHFAALHLRTLSGDDGYFQPFGYVQRVSVDAKATYFSLAGIKAKRGTDFTVLPWSGAGSFSSTVAFVGYGAVNDATSYDDYANIDVRGKVVLAMRFEPHDTKGHSRFTHGAFSPSAALTAKARAAADHGAVALLVVNPPLLHGEDDPLIPFMFGSPMESPLPIIQIKRDLADQLLKSAAAPTLGELQTRIDLTGAPASRSLSEVAASGDVQLVRDQIRAKNVVALLPGSGPHANEYVIVGAHYDHLGLGGPGSLAPWSHAIHHGADDNASGTAALLDLADHLVRDGRLDRSVILCCFSAEEEGMIGSSFFVAHPPVPLDHVVGMINMDMVGRVRNQTIYVGGDGTAADLPQLLHDADAGSPLAVRDIGRGGFGPSDHMSFALKHVPVLFLFSGMHRDYHTPTDTAEKINYPGIVETADLARRLVDEMATMPRESYVDKYDNEGLNLFATASIGSAPPVVLGVVPDYASMQALAGVRISSTTPGLPAQAAGLREGDVIVQIGATKIANLMDLMAFLSDAKPGQTVTIVVMRDKQRIEAPTTLAERKG